MALGEPWLGKSHFLVIMVRKELASLYADDLRDSAAAESQYRLLVDLFHQTGNAPGPDLGATMMNLARVLRGQKRYRDAEVILMDAIKILRETESSALGRCLHILGEVRSKDGRVAEAEAPLAEAVQQRRMHADGSRYWYGRAVDGYVVALRSLGKKGKAIETLQDNLPHLDKQELIDPKFHYEQACRRCLLGEMLEEKPAADTEAIRILREKALDSLEQAIREGYRDVIQMKSHRRLAAIRRTDRFQMMLARIQTGKN